MAGGRRILVVEDDGGVRGLVSEHLRKRGYEVVEAGDAEQVLLRMSRDRTPFDLVLTDMHLPGLSGLELLRLLLTHSPLRPVIMITGDADEALARRALGHGAAGYLLKPFELFELEAAVRQSLARLELVEAAESLARGAPAGGGPGVGGPGVGGPGSAADVGAAASETGPAGGSVPPVWLELADARSSAGGGHGHRVARIAAAIAAPLQDRLGPEERAALETAARTHELGRLLGPARTSSELVTRTGQLLRDLGVEPRVIGVVTAFRERWDGSGGPKGSRGDEIPLAARVLAAADALDHDAVARLDEGLEPAEAVGRALSEVRPAAEPRYGPDVAAAIDLSGRVIEAIWVLTRGPREPPSP